jgi:hypothetical protein
MDKRVFSFCHEDDPQKRIKVIIQRRGNGFEFLSGDIQLVDDPKEYPTPEKAFEAAKEAAAEDGYLPCKEVE